MKTDIPFPFLNSPLTGLGWRMFRQKWKRIMNRYLEGYKCTRGSANSPYTLQIILLLMSQFKMVYYIPHQNYLQREAILSEAFVYIGPNIDIPSSFKLAGSLKPLQWLIVSTDASSSLKGCTFLCWAPTKVIHNSH